MVQKLWEQRGARVRWGKEWGLRTNLVVFSLRRTGASLLFVAEAARDGSQGFAMQGLHAQRVRYESDALKALERAGVGSWSAFPMDSIQATVTRDQLKSMGFRGNY